MKSAIIAVVFFMLGIMLTAAILSPKLWEAQADTDAYKLTAKNALNSSSVSLDLAERAVSIAEQAAEKCR